MARGRRAAPASPDPAWGWRGCVGDLPPRSPGCRLLSCPLAISCSDPASGVASRVNMGERPVRGRAGIYAAPSYQRRVCPLDAIDRILDDFGICNIHAPVMIQVVHLAVAIVVDEDVVGIAVHVAAEGGAAPRIPSPGVVLRRSEAAHDADSVGIDSLFGQLRQYEFVFVDHLHVDDDVLRPHVLLIVRQKVFQLQVLRELSALILRCHLYEPTWRCVADARLPFARGRPVADVIESETPTFFFDRGAQRDDAEVSEWLDGIADF